MLSTTKDTVFRLERVTQGDAVVTLERSSQDKLQWVFTCHEAID